MLSWRCACNFVQACYHSIKLTKWKIDTMSKRNSFCLKRYIYLSLYNIPSFQSIDCIMSERWSCVCKLDTFWLLVLCFKSPNTFWPTKIRNPGRSAYSSSCVKYAATALFNQIRQFQYFSFKRSIVIKQLKYFFIKPWTNPEYSKGEGNDKWQDIQRRRKLVRKLRP